MWRRPLLLVSKSRMYTRRSPAAIGANAELPSPGGTPGDCLVPLAHSHLWGGDAVIVRTHAQGHGQASVLRLIGMHTRRRR